ncbi:response regulator [candidate division KSB1 bacterium]|nr:response regulator [candidate division KSB1 bacterium]
MQDRKKSEKSQILLVEDDQDQAFVVSYYLKSKGYGIDWCNTAKAAARKAFHHNYQLILLDVMLNSEQDGFQLCEFFKSTPTIQDIPIIMLTAKTAVKDRVNGLKLGADDYITKPFNKEELLARIESILERKNKIKYVEQFRDILENTDDIVLLLDLNGYIDHANRQAKKIIPELDNKKNPVKFINIFDEMFSSAISTFFNRVLKGFEVKGTGWRLKNKNNNIDSVDANLLPIHKGELIIGVGCILKDSSQRIKAIKEFEQKNRDLQQKVESTSALLNEVQQKLILSEKLAVMGELAAAIAHEIRNPLNTINSSIYYLHKKIQSSDPKIEEHLGIIKQEIQRTQKIITNLLEFSRKSNAKQSEIDINEILNQTIMLVENELSIHGIELNQKLIPVEKCLVNSDDIKQIFLNLVLNAKDAMPDGGKLTIKTGMDGKERIVVEITDTGKGIPRNMLDKIFDPFFTTKKEKQGVGIGLSIVHSAIERNNGTITVKSKEKKGSTFIISLPVSENTK